MTQITNLTRQSMSFTTGVKNGEAIVDDLPAGETKSINIAADHPHVLAKLHVGAISVGKADHEPARAKAEKPSA